MKKTWSQQEIDDRIKDYFTKIGGTTGSFATAFHKHNGSDSPRLVPATSLMGFPTILVADATVAPTDAPPNGTFRFYYDTVVVYRLWAYINNTWVGETLTP